MNPWNRFSTALSCAIVLVSSAPEASATTYSVAGVDAAAIQAVVDNFRADLGGNNGLGPCTGGCVPGHGRREINWDAVPDSFASGGANPFPGDFFNQANGAPAGRIRGAGFTTSGTFEVSADSSNPGAVATLFGNHSADNAADFAAFSQERIFGLIGTNQMDVHFSPPGAPAVAGLVRGFGVVFTDVELDASTRLDFFSATDQLLESVAAPAFGAGAETFDSFSFVGITFPDAVVARVHITNGGFDLNLVKFGANDAVAMDDFIFGEPSPVPLPTPLILFVSTVLLLIGARHRRGRVVISAPCET